MTNTFLSEKLTQIKEIHNTAIKDVADTVNDIDANEIDENEWNEFLIEVSNITNISVESLLENVAERNSYDTYLAEKAEADYQMMMAAEVPNYGCDIDEIP